VAIISSDMALWLCIWHIDEPFPLDLRIKRRSIVDMQAGMTGLYA